MKRFLCLLMTVCLLASVCLLAACNGDSETDAETSGITELFGGQTQPSIGEDDTLVTEPLIESGTPDQGGSKPDLIGLAKKLVDSFGSVPDAWSFLPESFGVENYVVDISKVPAYTDFETVSAIPTNYIGKQMNVVVELLNTCQTALGYVNTVYGSLNVIETAYQAFLNGDPDNYKQFGGTAGGFSYEIIMSEKTYLLTVAVGTVKVTLFSSVEGQTYGARVQLSESNVLKYTVTETGLKIAYNVLNSSSTQLEFVRNAENTNVVLGYIYEYLTIKDKELIATSTLLHVDENYTTVVGTKGDFIPTSDSLNCEVYSSKTGRLIGSEVRESLSDGKKVYNTLWYNLADISGITSIKKEDKPNGVNPDKIYINGKSSDISSMFVDGLADTSRRFDIEFKMVMAYTYDPQTQTYTSVEYEVPMMFIQETNFGTFASDFKSKNDVSVAVTVVEADRNAVNRGYYVLVDIYNTIKTAVTQQNIIDYCKEDFQMN